MSNKVAWYCQNCGRIEAEPNEAYCPECAEKMQRCSRYEWFLFDALEEALARKGAKFRMQAQYPIKDHRGFIWHFDIYVWVNGRSHFGGYGELIEVNGSDHERQSPYSGPGGGYTRDYDKHWEVYNNLRLHKQGIEIRTVSNEECTKKDWEVYVTADEISEHLITRAGGLA